MVLKGGTVKVEYVQASVGHASWDGWGGVKKGAQLGNGLSAKLLKEQMLHSHSPSFKSNLPTDVG
jgi:hypothetical protein